MKLPTDMKVFVNVKSNVKALMIVRTRLSRGLIHTLSTFAAIHIGTIHGPDPQAARNWDRMLKLQSGARCKM